MKCSLPNKCARRNRCCRHCPENKSCWQACKDNYKKCKYFIAEQDEEPTDTTAEGAGK